MKKVSIIVILVIFVILLSFSLFFILKKATPLCGTPFYANNSKTGQCEFYVGCSLPSSLIETAECKEILIHQVDGYNKERYACNIDNDCTSQCANGCVNQDWAELNPDSSECFRAWECSCIGNLCYTDGRPPK